MTTWLWLTFNWPVVFFLFVLGVGLVVTLFFRATGMLLLSLTLYFGMIWHVPQWLQNLYWLAFFVAGAGIIIGLINGRARAVAVYASGFALFLSIVFVNANFFGTNNPEDAIVKGIKGRLVQIELAQETETKARKEGDLKLNKRVTSLQRRVTRLEYQLDSQDGTQIGK